MSDERRVITGPGLVGADGRVPRSMRDSQRRIEEETKVQSDKPCTEGRVAELLTAGLIGGLKDIVEHFAAANSEHMEQMEHIVAQRVREDLQAIVDEALKRDRANRSLRGRARALLEHLRGYALEIGILSPIPPPAAAPAKIEGVRSILRDPAGEY